MVECGNLMRPGNIPGSVVGLMTEWYCWGEESSCLEVKSRVQPGKGPLGGGRGGLESGTG